MMKNILIILAIVLIASPLWAATNKVATALDNSGETISLKITNDQPLGGLAIALKFAEPGSDVMLTKVDFSGTRMQDVDMLKEAVIDNEKKTVLIYAIPLQNYIEAGTDAIAKLTFSDLSRVKLEPTTVAKHEGISLVSADAKEMDYEFDFTGTGRNPLPTSFSVSQNYPNPFNASTVIKYSLPENSRVRIEIFNILGQKVRTLVDEVQTAGYKSIEWNGTNASNQTVASGVYFYKIQADKRTEIKQMTLLK